MMIILRCYNSIRVEIYLSVNSTEDEEFPLSIIMITDII